MKAPAPGLRATQDLFWDLIAAPEGVEPGAEALAREGRLASPDLSFLIRGDGRMGPAERLDVYANMYFYRLRDCLADDFTKVAAVVGGAAFHNLVTDYLLAHPSRHWSLRYLGEAMPGFLDTHPLSAERPWLGDLARLEWARIDVFDAADAPALTREEMTAGAAASGDVSLRLIPACRLLGLDWGVAPVWRQVEAAHAGEEGAHATHSAAVEGSSHACFPEPLEVAPPARRATGILVWRRRLGVLHRTVERDERACLEALSGGAASLAALGQILLEARDGEDVEAATRRLAGLVSEWLQAELLQGSGG